MIGGYIVMDSSADDYNKKIGNIIFFSGVLAMVLIILLLGLVLGLVMWLNGEFDEENLINNQRDKNEENNNSITKQFIMDHGMLTSEIIQNIKEIRTFLMDSGSVKAEQVALMNDKETENAISKDYFFIQSNEGLYIIRRTALASIVSDVYFMENTKTIDQNIKE